MVLLWLTILVVFALPIHLAPVTEFLGILIFGIGWAIKKVSQRSTNKADHELTEVVVEP